MNQVAEAKAQSAAVGRRLGGGSQAEPLFRVAMSQALDKARLRQTPVAKGTQSARDASAQARAPAGAAQAGVRADQGEAGRLEKARAEAGWQAAWSQPRQDVAEEPGKIAGRGGGEAQDGIDGPRLNEADGSTGANAAAAPDAGDGSAAAFGTIGLAAQSGDGEANLADLEAALLELAAGSPEGGAPTSLTEALSEGAALGTAGAETPDAALTEQPAGSAAERTSAFLSALTAARTDASGNDGTAPVQGAAGRGSSQTGQAAPAEAADGSDGTRGGAKGESRESGAAAGTDGLRGRDGALGGGAAPIGSGGEDGKQGAAASAAETRRTEEPTAKTVKEEGPTAPAAPRGEAAESQAAVQASASGRTDGANGANSAGATEAPKGEAYSQIAVRVMENLANRGPKQISMSLWPEDLGKIDISMKAFQGKLVINIAAESAKTHELLMGQVDKLVSVLGASNLHVESVSVASQTSQQQGGQSHYEQYQPAGAGLADRDGEGKSDGGATGRGGDRSGGPSAAEAAGAAAASGSGRFGGRLDLTA